MTPCAIAAKVAAEVVARSEVGRLKYGHTLDRAGLSRLQLLQHAKEEAMDLACYLQTLIEMETVA